MVAGGSLVYIADNDIFDRKEVFFYFYKVEKFCTPFMSRYTFYIHCKRVWSLVN